MRFRLGLLTGFATGYYLGAKAGRRRYDQINRAVSWVRRSDMFGGAAERARTVVEEGVEKALSLVDGRAPSANGFAPAHPAGPADPAGPPGYSSSR